MPLQSLEKKWPRTLGQNSSKALCALVVIMIVVVVPAIAVAVVVMIPVVIVLEPAVVAVPIPREVALPIVVRRYPARAGIGRTRPVAGMPFVVSP